MALIRMPASTYSTAADLVMPITPHLAAAYPACPAIPMTPAPEEVLTMAPPAACISGISCFMHRNTPVRSTSTIRCHSSVASSASGVRDCSTPALLNARSSRPKVSTVRSSAARTSSSRVTSQVSASARPPSVSISRAVSRTPSSGTPATATAAPSAAKARAVARPMPMPLPAPVTKATCPAKRALSGAVTEGWRFR